MGSRFLVTGVQLGIIEALSESNPDKIKDQIEIIQRKQGVGDSPNEISEDVLVMREGKLPMLSR